MATTRNSTWIATTALSMLGEASVDNPAAPEDLVLALDRLGVVQDDLQGRNICYIPDIDFTPSAIALHVASALALSLQPDYGYQLPPGQGPIPPQDVIDANIKLINSNGPQGFPMSSLGY